MRNWERSRRTSFWPGYRDCGDRHEHERNGAVAFSNAGIVCSSTSVDQRIAAVGSAHLLQALLER
jgi:hypothetical protein